MRACGYICSFSIHVRRSSSWEFRGNRTSGCRQPYVGPPGTDFRLVVSTFRKWMSQMCTVGAKKITQYSAPNDLEKVACVDCGHVFWERSISERFISKKFSEFACPECSSFNHRYTGTSLPKGKITNVECIRCGYVFSESVLRLPSSLAQLAILLSEDCYVTHVSYGVPVASA